MPDLYGSYSSESTLKGNISSGESITGRISVGTIIDDKTQTYILIDEDGNEIPAVLVDEEVALTATANDIRQGTTAITDDGVITGEKFIPPYFTSVGTKIIRAHNECVIPLNIRDAFDYTALQCIVCPFDTSMDKSVAAEKVAISDKVYAVKSTDVLSEVIKDRVSKSVKLGITNDSDTACIIRYFTYKEEI